MKLPVAYAAHSVPGRTRLRVPGRRHDEEFFARAVATLEEMEGVGPVTANARTASLLVVHRDDVEALGAFARERELFDLVPAPVAPVSGPPRTLPEVTRDTLDLADFAVRVKSNGRTDLATLTFAALVGGAVVQAVRGQFLPASVTLLAYAMRLVPPSGASGGRDEGARP